MVLARDTKSTVNQARDKPRGFDIRGNRSILVISCEGRQCTLCCRTTPGTNLTTH